MVLASEMDSLTAVNSCLVCQEERQQKSVDAYVVNIKCNIYIYKLIEYAFEREDSKLGKTNIFNIELWVCVCV